MRPPWPTILTALGQLALLLPAFLFLWFTAGEWLIPGLARMLEPVLIALWPETVLSVETAGRKLLVVTRLAASVAADPHIVAQRKGVLVNPFTYSYGLPLFAALALASTASWRQHLLRLSIGFGILTLGLCCSILVSLLYLFQHDGDYRGFHAFGGDAWNDMLVAYAHFLGFNLVPRLLPLLLWILLYRDWLWDVMREIRR